MSTKLKPDEYLDQETGRIMCSKCHTPRRLNLNLGGEPCCIPVQCACQQAAWEAREQMRKHQEFLDRVQRNRSLGMQDPSLFACTFQNAEGDNPTLVLARRYAEHWEEMLAKNMGLLFWGDVGTGKTYLAACIINALLDQGVEARMTNLSHVLNDLSNYQADKNAVLQELNRYDFLALDDFGMERTTEYSLEQIFNVVDGRCRSRRPLLVTTNLTVEELKSPRTIAQARIYDRILECCVPVQVKGRNRRREKAREHLDVARKLLGSTV